jgi:hypothetical protein
MPARESIETFINELLAIGNVQAKYTINNFQIIGDEIVDNTDNIK